MLFSNLALHIFGYLSMNAFLGRQGINHNVAIAWDYQIPFIKYFSPVYSVVYFIPVVTFFFCWKEYEILKAAFKSFFTAGLICLVFFFLYPVSFTLRTSLVPPFDFFTNIVRFFYWVDNPPYNCLPSLHVALAFISARVIYLCRPKLAPFFYALATAISLLTLFIRQHYILDLVAGLGVALLMDWLFLPLKLSAKLRETQAVPVTPN